MRLDINDKKLIEKIAESLASQDGLIFMADFDGDADNPRLRNYFARAKVTIHWINNYLIKNEAKADSTELSNDKSGDFRESNEVIKTQTESKDP